MKLSPKAVAFFRKHAGYAKKPSETVAQAKTRMAKALAKAEAEASARGWTVEWEHEVMPDLSWADEEEQDEIDEVLMAALKDEHGRVLASLGNITFGKDNVANRAYKRVVEAELADEALYEEKK